MAFLFRIVPHNSAEYDKTVALRYRILRVPLGLTFDPKDLAAEHTDHHLTLWNEDTDQPAAVLLMHPQSDGVVKMRQFAVDDSLQKQGLGSRLVDEAERWAQQKGFRLITLHARQTAVPFYLRLGYQVEGDTFTEVTIPHRYMKKALPPAGNSAS